MSLSRTLKTLLAGAGAILALALPTSASAGVLVADASKCDTQVLTQPFVPWADLATYTLNPSGDFESGTAHWSLDNASTRLGNEPWSVSGATDKRSLEISDGGSATSAPICVGIGHPDLRFFAKPSNPSATLTLEVLFEDANGDVQSAPVGAITGSRDWSISPRYPIVANLLSLLPGSQTAVAFRFSATDGSVRIDDVYVDPYSRW